MWQGIPECRDKGSVPQGSALGSGDGGQQIGEGRRGNGVEKVSEVGGGQVIEGFVSEEEEFELYAILEREILENIGSQIFSMWRITGKFCQSPQKESI